MGRSLVVDVQLEDGSQEEVPCGLVRLQERCAQDQKDWQIWLGMLGFMMFHLGYEETCVLELAMPC